MLESAPASISLLQAVTLAIAFVGAVLGIINTWHAIDKSRVKLKVRPSHAIPGPGASQSIEIALEITNLSSFAVTVDDVGVFFREGKHRVSYISPILLDGGAWPRRLEPRSSVTVYGSRPPARAGRIRCAYAKTQCGVTVTGNSPALRQISAEGAAQALRG